MTHVYWFRATGGYIKCGCGRPSNLVLFDDVYFVTNFIVIISVIPHKNYMFNTYRFDEIQEDIEENLTETMESVSPDETTVADQEEIMDL